MTDVDRTTILPELLDRARVTLLDAGRGLADAELTTDQKARVWDNASDSIMRIISDAYDTIPGDIPEDASPRTALLEVAVRSMTEKLIEFPSNQYTFESTRSLAAALEAIKTSMEIDAKQAKETHIVMNQPTTPPKPITPDPGVRQS